MAAAGRAANATVLRLHALARSIHKLCLQLHIDDMAYNKKAAIVPWRMSAGSSFHGHHIISRSAQEVHADAGVFKIRNKFIRAKSRPLTEQNLERQRRLTIMFFRES